MTHCLDRENFGHLVWLTLVLFSEIIAHHHFFFFSSLLLVLVCGRISFVPCHAQEMGTGEDVLSRYFFGTHFIKVFSGAWELFYVLARNFY